MPLSNNFIYSGPRKLQNNLLKSFKDNKNVSFNDYKYENSYLLQYDHIYGKKAYNKIIKHLKIKIKKFLKPIKLKNF